MSRKFDAPVSIMDCGLIDARISASQKDLPVPDQLQQTLNFY